MRRTVILLVLVALIPQVRCAHLRASDHSPLTTHHSPLTLAQFKMEPGPKSPQDSLKCIQTRPGFKVELMVAEPLVKSPIAFAWGPDGKFWVVEMGDYPLGIDGKGKPGGKIKFLEKSKPDGPYDKMTLFMDGLGFPTGVFPYKNGVLVTCAPDIFYAEMGKDGKVQKEVLFTGFKEGNQQHRVNGLTWGIDNWIYGANGDSGGIIEGGKLTGLLPRKIMQGKVNISGRDFRFKPDTGEFEAVTGQSQFGRCRDDWGNWFGNNNSNPMFHFVLEDRYLKRNPHVLYPDPRVPVVPGAIRVYPISKPLPRFNSPQALNHFTSACSTIIYRDNLFGPEFEGNAFVSEPVHNLVHRVIVKPKGVTFTGQRADDEKESEFLASSDNWFRPTMIQVGPDGALWIADMYRYVIEHPEWIPKDWQKKLDLRAGQDKGRIYRVYPAAKKPREIVRMDKMKVEELDAALENPNGWVRDTAHQILLRQVELLETGNERIKFRENLQKSRKGFRYSTPQARVHAAYAYEPIGLGRHCLSPTDTHPEVRKHYVIQESKDHGLLIGFEKLLKDEKDERVRMQIGVCLGEFGILPRRERHRMLATFLCENADHRYLLAAGMSSVSDTEDIFSGVVLELIQRESVPIPVLLPMIKSAKAFGTRREGPLLFVRRLTADAKAPVSEQLTYVGDLLDALDTDNPSLKELFKEVGLKDVAHTMERLRELHVKAVEIATNPKATAQQRASAVRVFARGIGKDNEDHKVLVKLLSPQSPEALQGAIVSHVSRYPNDPRVPALLLTPWKGYSPALRGQVLDTLFSRPLWTKMTLDAIRKKEVAAHEIDAIRRQRLLQHKDKDIRERAEKLFSGSSNPDRGRIVDLYWLQLPEKTDVAKGAKLFAKSCATCHKLGDVGQNVGPDLAAVGDKSVQGLLTAILDPNRAVESRYINYAASTKAGKTFTGIMQSETSTTITLVGPDGKAQQLLRNEIDELYSTGKSLMPDGVEKDLSPQDVADIIAFVRGNQPIPKRKQFPGNEPRVLHPAKDGRLHLLANSAAVYGPSLIIEKQYGNLGYWSNREDHALWTVELAKETTFSVWLDFACANDSANNMLVVQCGTEKLLYKVQGTGTWDMYQLQVIGNLRIPAGIHDIVVRSQGPIRGSMIDLKGLELRPR